MLLCLNLLIELFDSRLHPAGLLFVVFRHPYVELLGHLQEEKVIAVVERLLCVLEHTVTEGVVVLIRGITMNAIVLLC